MKYNINHWVKAAAISLLTSTAFAANTDIQVLSATIKDQKISDAEVILQKNGNQSVSASTDNNGKTSINTSFADDQDALLIIKKNGYSNLVAKCPCNGMTYALSPEMKDLDGVRVVLNWGAEPEDLDSHLVYPNNHVYFSNQEGDAADLDVDDTTSYGPETITIQRKKDGQRYVYAVHNFSDRENPASDSLSKSNAVVFVYVGKTLVRTYYVPKNQQGNLWTIFAINESGEFIDYNTIKGVTSYDRLQTAEFRQVTDNSVAADISVSESDKQYAVSLNRKGEAAYKEKDFNAAINHFQSAIEINPQYGQAYSDLGLTFQKTGRVAEAIWANRKAIALASGSAAATVKANSYYNNGRIYEAAGQWNDALREYQNAKQHKNKQTYDEAIERMMSKTAN